MALDSGEKKIYKSLSLVALYNSYCGRVAYSQQTHRYTADATVKTAQHVVKESE